MKSMHRTKTIAAYDGARLALKNNMAYPAYILLKEATRGVLAYIIEDRMDKDISEKMKLKSLLSFIDDTMVSADDIVNIEKLISIEASGIEGILSANIDDLIEIKRSIKHIISEYMHEPI